MQQDSTILIVDDQPRGRENMEKLLKEGGYRLEFARNGLEALAKAEALTPDLIVLDVMMPQMNGFEVCQRLRATAGLAEVPIILVTALDDYDSRLRGIEVGADDFISKPFDLVEFQARIRTITRLGRFRRLLMERAKFEWLVEQAEEGYLMLSEQDEILYANSRARHYLGLIEEDKRPVQPSFLEVVREHYHCEPKEAWSSWPDQPSTIPPSPRFLIHAEIPTAPALWLRVDLLALHGERQAGWLVRLRDVSREMALQQDMWKFHAVVSHKLRTPAANATSSLSLLARHAAKLSTEEIVEMAESAERNLQRLREEIEDIFQYLTAPTLALPGAGVRLAELEVMVADIISDLELEPVVITLPEELERTILISVQGLELILREILQNAKKFHPRQAPRVEMEIATASFKEIRIRIADDGATLSPGQLAQVWTPYYQGERHFSGEVQGMGLGLPMVAALIWEAGGSSSISNRPEGPGVIVDLILPTRRTLPPLSF